MATTEGLLSPECWEAIVGSVFCIVCEHLVQWGVDEMVASVKSPIPYTTGTKR